MAKFSLSSAIALLGKLDAGLVAAAVAVGKAVPDWAPVANNVAIVGGTIAAILAFVTQFEGGSTSASGSGPVPGSGTQEPPPAPPSPPAV